MGLKGDPACSAKPRRVRVSKVREGTGLRAPVRPRCAPTRPRVHTQHAWPFARNPKVESMPRDVQEPSCGCAQRGGPRAGPAQARLALRSAISPPLVTLLLMLWASEMVLAAALSVVGRGISMTPSMGLRSSTCRHGTAHITSHTTPRASHTQRSVPDAPGRVCTRQSRPLPTPPPPPPPTHTHTHRKPQMKFPQTTHTPSCLQSPCAARIRAAPLSPRQWLRRSEAGAPHAPRSLG